MTGYEAQIREHRLAFSRGCAWAAIVLILLGMGLDYGLYPERQVLFGEARIFFSLLILAIIGLMRTRWGEAHGMELTFTWLVLPQVMITWMIAETEGASSLYYGGLPLAIFASGLALPFTVWQNVAFSAVTFVLWIAACSAHPESFTMRGALVVNSLFLIMSASISAICTYFNERARFRLFRLRAEVAATNSQLEKTNRDLADIKGQMLQQEKMAAIGTLSAGLLHEVNNPVNFCMMAIDVGMEDPAARASPSLMECLSDAKQGMQRVHYIVGDLKKFAYRKPDSEMQPSHFLFERALSSALRLVGHEIKGVQVNRSLPDDTLVSGDEAAIVGVLINLLGNAGQACRDSGRQESVIDVVASWNGDRLGVMVRDNGRGIAPELLGRVFEPFFTTREVGKGLGLGLSISYSVIQRHGGTLRVESALGEWTRFIFDLPRAA
ncbi:sensor histidine kinase [Pseudoduganella sp. GCM10020061]|uniref:sensor histidine kinase n=1 Tax=Pseudoduganella sp. GCM10020061 TaxID=3317345 RepID=UPI003631D4B9